MGAKVFRTIVFPILVGISIFLSFSSPALTQPWGKGQKAEKPRISGSSLREVVISTQPNGVKVELKVDGVIPDFNSFKLDDPPRLVLDFPDMSNASSKKNIIVGHPLLKDIRMGQHTDKVRVVFAFPGEEVLRCRITKDSQTIGVFIGQFKEEKASKEKPPEAKIQEPVRPTTPLLPALAPAAMDIPRAEDKKPSFASEAEAEKPKPYTGAKISLDLMNADLWEVFELISNAARKEIIPSEGVEGVITLRLIDVPWDQALDAILRNRNLKKIEVGNVIRIIPGEKMLKEKEKKKD